MTTEPSTVVTVIPLVIAGSAWTVMPERPSSASRAQPTRSGGACTTAGNPIHVGEGAIQVAAQPGTVRGIQGCRREFRFDRGQHLIEQRLAATEHLGAEPAPLDEQHPLDLLAEPFFLRPKCAGSQGIGLGPGRAAQPGRLRFSGLHALLGGASRIAFQRGEEVVKRHEGSEPAAEDDQHRHHKAQDRHRLGNGEEDDGGRAQLRLFRKAGRRCGPDPRLRPRSGQAGIPTAMAALKVTRTGFMIQLLSRAG